LRSVLPEVQFESEISPRSPAFVGDHAFYGQAVFPAAGYCEMALAAGRAVWGPGHPSLADLSIEGPLVLPEGTARTVQLILSEDGSFRIASLEEPAGVWHSHARGRIRAEAAPAAPAEGSLAAAQGRCRTEMLPAPYYAMFQEQGVTYGPSFRGIDRLWSGEGEAVGHLRLPESTLEGAGAYFIHPALLDAGFQLLGAAQPAEQRGREVYMPVQIARVTVHGEIGSALWGHAALRPRESAESISADIRFFDEAGGLVLEVLGLGLRRARPEALDKVAPPRYLDWLYALDWRPQPPSPRATPPPSRWLLLADQGGIGADLARRLRARGETVFVASPGPAFASAADGHLTLDPRAPQDFERLLRAAHMFQQATDWHKRHPAM
jgi:myxalamid-type polyketide synthase MxaB